MRLLLLGLITLAYPALVYLGLGRVEPRWLALLLAGTVLLRVLATRDRVWLLAGAGALLLVAISLAGNLLLPLKLYPMLVNATLLAVFATSLVYPPSMIERLARLREPDLPASGVAYTRKVTQVWCGFFAVNGSLALITSCWASDAIWALYNGLIAYIAMGALFGGEWLVRQRVKAKGVHD
ncbi:hypothetical protein [Chitinolyticbacter albus]|uniref:COG4648 family protein n=1 Tax=Chitinolyticbacter albus TaxID=2961951 RepID=UPI00210EFED1|nr:hypothetical protein [Chitinolyticbacter albus]